MDPLTAFFIMVAEGFKFGREVVIRIPEDVSAEQWRDWQKVLHGILDAMKPPPIVTPKLDSPAPLQST